jgi:hypothetical protein
LHAFIHLCLNSTDISDKTIRDRIQMLEDHIKMSKTKLSQMRTGEPSLRYGLAPGLLLGLLITSPDLLLSSRLAGHIEILIWLSSSRLWRWLT